MKNNDTPPTGLLAGELSSIDLDELEKEFILDCLSSPNRYSRQTPIDFLEWVIENMESGSLTYDWSGNLIKWEFISTPFQIRGMSTSSLFSLFLNKANL